MDVVARERVLYEDVYDTVSRYAIDSPGQANFPLFLEMAGDVGVPRSEMSILDAGCGGGYGALAFKEAGFGKVVMCDITDFGLSNEAKASGMLFYQTALWDSLHVVAGGTLGRCFDYVYCCDVLEHIPKEFSMLVVSRLLEVSRHGVFMSICHKLDVHGLWVGKHLHQTVESFNWWRDNLSVLGEIVECRDLLSNGLFLVRRRR